jgi:hypothetical protein
VFKDFKVGRDMLIGAIISAATVLLQYWFGLISVSDWQGHKWRWILSVVLPFGAYLCLHILTKAVRAPYEVHRDREQLYEQELSQLRSFRRNVEDREVRLEMKECNTRIVIHRYPDRKSEDGLGMIAIFANNRKAGLPGKIATQVAARITYVDADGRRVNVDGRWAQTDQPETVGEYKSKLPLLRIDFGVGSELELDLVAKFPQDVNLLCYAVDNNSFPYVRQDRTALHGNVSARIELIAEYVHQFFEVDIENSVGKLRHTSAREIHAAE